MFTLGQTLSRADFDALPVGATIGLARTPESPAAFVRVPMRNGRIMATIGTPEVARYLATDFDENWALRSLPEEASAPRYSFREDVTVTGYDGLQFGILDLLGNRFARFGRTEVSDFASDGQGQTRDYLRQILAGSFDPESLFWHGPADITVPGAAAPAPAPRVEPSALERFGRERMLIANIVWEHVRRAGNEHYYGSLVAAGLLPDRHAVLAFRATLANDTELSDWLRELAEAANEGGMCEVYDQMCREVGLPDREELGVPRTREYLVTGYATVTVRVPVSTYITASGADDALDGADDAEPDLSDILDAVRDRAFEIDSTDWKDAEIR